MTHSRCVFELSKHANSLSFQDAVRIKNRLSREMAWKPFTSSKARSFTPPFSPPGRTGVISTAMSAIILSDQFDSQ
jgi:hypothetical protein